jgi:hypothetical protein
MKIQKMRARMGYNNENHKVRVRGLVITDVEVTTLARPSGRGEAHHWESSSPGRTAASVK